VDFGAHIALDAQVVAVGATVSSFATSIDQPPIPYWTLGFADTCLRLLGSDDFAPQVKADAAAELTDALVEGALQSRIALRVPLESIAEAHERVEAGAGGRVVVEIG
jgi:NADPH2:quinone reductase